MIKAGFLPNISDEGKDFVATWFPGFPLLSHPALCADSYIGMKEIFRKRDEVKHSQREKYQEMEESCKEIERENSKTPTKTLSSNKQKSVDIKSARDLKITRMNAIQRKKQLRTPGMLQAKKRLDFLNHECPKSYSLINLHRHMLGCSPAQSHGAEVDCLSLLRITSALGLEWTQWIKDNHQLFRNCTKLWSY